MTDALEKKPQRTATFHVTLCPPPSCHPDSHPIQSLDTLRIFRLVPHLPTYQSIVIHIMFMVITTSQEHRIVIWPTTMWLDPCESSACDTAIICIFGETTKIGDLLSKIMLAHTKPSRSLKKNTHTSCWDISAPKPATELVVETAPSLQGPSVAV